MATNHIPVLFQEVLDGLRVGSGDRHVDATVGGGGHAAGILAASAPDGRLLCLDRDAAAVEVARGRLTEYSDRVEIAHSSFACLEAQAHVHDFTSVDGVLFDLGLSSLQLGDPSRGFAFLRDGPLDMRFDATGDGLTAADLLNNWPADELAALLARFGEERQSRRIAAAIIAARPLHTTTKLVEVIESTATRRGRIHPATRTFQALRIAVNGELDAVERALPQAVGLLAPGGRLVVISFHSLEDRLVKRFFRRESRQCICPPDAPACICDHRASLKLIARKPIRASVEEVAANPRARSARLRIAERIAA